MTNFFANFNVVIAKPSELADPAFDIEAKPDNLGGCVLLVNSEGGYFQDNFGDQQTFTKHERQQLTLFAIGSFLKRNPEARRKYLPGLEDECGVDVALAEGAVERGEL